MGDREVTVEPAGRDAIRRPRRARTIRACSAASYPPSQPDRPRRAILLDRDGTLIVDHPYSSDPDRIELLDGAVDGLLALQQAGYLLVVLTNQSGVARGFYGEAAIRRMHRRLDAMLGRAGVEVAAYYYCPHHVDGVVRSLARPCFCRKPEPGMLFRAARDWAIDLGQSWMLGDLTSDVAAGRAAGCRTLLIGDRDAGAGARVPNLREAAKVIVAEGGA